MDYTAVNLILQAGYVVKGVMVMLLIFSVTSWGIIIYKWRYFSKARSESLDFLKYFRAGREPGGLNKLAKACEISPLANIYTSVYEDSTLVDIGDVRRALNRYSALESARLEKYLNFLATTGSSTPFVGLFGTVWGIMNAFRGIGASGSASLAVVAPGIAEALITTAAGLAAAIPAVIFYNYYLSTAKRLIIEMDDFSEDLMAFFANIMNEPRRK
ncbi:MotA/TolQ/ExbB proton channel family protein [Candidatus Magnetominusculus xianensis]|uniref:Flagellar motor protein MotA n=1 Tax=Candidatus Magnetominusculus xianensis TaxID=1748249 RepID=A0ABR5SFN4_9BACT|nr:MotA/TolQ/ExbB proton channel family protein [Candidatus Magnetominusculus xianensis]KWT84403.1 flagellar motor protein MotA [Candidatus Magnetominusculus xianensis]MBF0404237.1 MotA/TolQ/ExbB proton channel family protein [Nitrospirota bacterium]